jgi:hypothetical protein
MTPENIGQIFQVHSNDGTLAGFIRVTGLSMKGFNFITWLGPNKGWSKSDSGMLDKYAAEYKFIRMNRLRRLLMLGEDLQNET